MQKIMMNFPIGRPTKPDVDQLFIRWPDLKPGDIIPYSEIEKVIGVTHRTSRFQIVAGAWRKLLRVKCNLELQPTGEKSYQVMNNSERVTASSLRVKYGVRKIVRAGDLAARTSRLGLSSEENRIKDHMIAVATAINLDYLSKNKELKFDLKEVSKIGSV